MVLARQLREVFRIDRQRVAAKERHRLTEVVALWLSVSGQGWAAARGSGPEE
jgi:hypothetical protein